MTHKFYVLVIRILFLGKIEKEMKMLVIVNFIRLCVYWLILLMVIQEIKIKRKILISQENLYLFIIFDLFFINLLYFR